MRRAAGNRGSDFFSRGGKVEFYHRRYFARRRRKKFCVKMKFKIISIAVFLVLFFPQFVFAGYPRTFGFYEINGEIQRLSCDNFLGEFLDWPLFKTSFLHPKKRHFPDEEFNKFKEITFKKLQTIDKFKVAANFVARFLIAIIPLGLFFLPHSQKKYFKILLADF